MRTGGVEPAQHEATGLQPAELANAQRPRGTKGVAGRARTGASGDHNPGCFRLHHGHHESGDDRARTGGLSPDKRALCSSELRPQSSAGGIRTHGLELMRLARTAAPLPRKVWLAGVEPAISGARSRWGGQLPYSQLNLRSAPPAGLEPAASGLRARRHRQFDHGGTRLRRQQRKPAAAESSAAGALPHAASPREAEPAPRD